MLTSLRQAIRPLRRSPGFAFAAILTLAVGVGANTAVFSVVSTALLHPLPYHNSDRLVAMQETRGKDEISVSYLDFLDWRAQSHTFSQLAAYTGLSFNLTGGGEAERIRGQIVTANLFETVQVRPALGRAFRSEEDSPGAANVVAISDALWRRRFGADPTLVGRSITLSDVPYTVVAIMPEGFRFSDGIIFGPADLWVPMSGLGASDRNTRASHPGLVVIGSLRPGTTLVTARAELSAVSARLRATYPASNTAIGVSVRPALDRVIGDLRPALWILLAAVVLVLIIACSNVAALILTRVVSRRRELAIRVALGASRWRLAGQVCAESGFLAVTGGLAGIALAVALTRLGAPLLSGLPRLEQVHLDLWAILVALLTISATAVAFGAFPIWWIGRTDVEQWLHARGSTNDPASVRLRRFLVGGEITLSVVLLVSAGLLLKTFARLGSERGGVEPDGVLTFAVRLPEATYPGASVAHFVHELTARLAELPGVAATGGVSVLPFSGAGAQAGFRPFGSPATPEAERRADVQVATPDYFRAMGIRVLQGRVFSDQDGADAPKVAVVDERFAAAFWPNGQNPVGQRVSGWGLDTLTVVGVVGHVKNYGIAAESRQELYVPHAQRPFQRFTLVIRAATTPEVLVPAARRVVAALDPNVPIYEVRTMDDLLASTIAAPRLAAVLSGSFAVIAMLLAVVGIYGVTAHLVTRRTREIGVRMALGATPGSVIRLVVGQAMRLATWGVGLGVLASLAATQVLRSQVYGVSVTDGATFVLVAGVLLTVAGVASSVPALRASRVSPLVALQEEQ